MNAVNRYISFVTCYLLFFLLILKTTRRNREYVEKNYLPFTIKIRVYLLR